MGERLDELKRDCRWFRSERPCTPAKLRGKTCAACDEYAPSPPSVAVVKLAAVGDVLRTTAFVPSIVAAWPDHRLHWVTSPEAAPLLLGNPDIHAVWPIEAETLPDVLLHEAMDAVLCPDADPRTAGLAARLPLRAGGRRVGFTVGGRGLVEPLSDAAERWFRLGVDDAAKRANRETYQDLVGAVLGLPGPVRDRPGLHLSAAERDAARHWLTAQGAVPGLLVGLNTGAGGRWPRKQWTPEGQRALIEAVARRGGRVVLLGGPQERERHARLLDDAPEGAVVDAGNDNDLRGFAARLGLCDVLVTGDTMALHMATALRVPVVALFGPTSSAEIELYGDGAKVFDETLDCLVCYSTCDRSPSCMDRIDVDMVLQALDRVAPRRA
ncbi:MAG: glycosyltransferase family 9 protein [Planctomycetota bacterium]